MSWDMTVIIDVDAKRAKKHALLRQEALGPGTVVFSFETDLEGNNELDFMMRFKHVIMTLSSVSAFKDLELYDYLNNTCNDIDEHSIFVLKDASMWTHVMAFNRRGKYRQTPDSDLEIDPGVHSCYGHFSLTGDYVDYRQDWTLYHHCDVHFSSFDPACLGVKLNV